MSIPAVLSGPADIPVYGLILAGGQSTRMQRDKAALKYRGRTQLDRAFELASRHVAKVFVSVRANQTLDAARAQRPLIVDAVPGEGPIAGIRSAMAAYPGAAWLVLACDLPFLNTQTLAHLLQARAVKRAATAYLSSHDGLPEPLCAIYEPVNRSSSAIKKARCCRSPLLAIPITRSPARVRCSIRCSSSSLR